MGSCLRRGDVERFDSDLARLGFAAGRLGIAVSGGADSLALLLLAVEALPGRVAAATVDHGLRRESVDEARFVGDVCAKLGVPHASLPVRVGDGPGPQAAARAVRYAALAGWAAREGLAAVATAHHADDQAETLLLRLARGSGSSGMSGVRPATLLSSGTGLLRPVLGWRRTELARIVAAAGLTPVVDPSNTDPRYDRTAARTLLADTAWLDPARLAASAAHLAEADAALAWATDGAWQARATVADNGVDLDVSGLPVELRRRLLLRAFAALDAGEPPGPKLAAFTARLAAGGTATLAGIRGEGGARWRFRRAPPRQGH